LLPDSNKFPNFKDIPSVKVTLSPGDVLYLPPYWFHRVIAEDVSISVSVWCDSEEVQMYYDYIQKQPLPFEDSWTKEQFAVSLQIFGKMLIDSIFQKEGSYIKFVNEFLLEQRYTPLFNKIQQSHVCNSKEPLWEQFRESLSIDKFQKQATITAGLFHQIYKFSNETIIRDITLAQYIELVTENFLGVDWVIHFLQVCFN